MADAHEIEPDGRYLVCNRTPYLIRIRRNGGTARSGNDPDLHELVLPPFAKELTAGTALQPFEQELRRHRQQHEIRVTVWRERRNAVSKWMWLTWVALAAFAVVTIFDVVEHGTLLRPEWPIASGLVTLVVAAMVTIAIFTAVRGRTNAEKTIQPNDIVFGDVAALTDADDAASPLRRILAVLLLVTVGVLLPTAAIVWATDTKDFLVIEGGLHVVSGQESRLVSRLIQITFVIVLSMFPALLFFQSERQHSARIRRNWIQAIFRIDVRMRTLADVHARYGDELDLASEGSAMRTRLLGDNYSPIVVATTVIALGWTLLVLGTDSYDFASASRAEPDSSGALEVLAPEPGLAGMAFLGAYFFGVHLVLGRYFSGYLSAKTYNLLTARLVTVVVLAYLVAALLGDTSESGVLLAVAFLVGVVPGTYIEWVSALVSGWTGRVFGAAPIDLMLIDGFDLADRSRLTAEGIPDVAALASSDLVTVMVNTRLPIGRLVDWADQAALMVSVGVGSGRHLSPDMTCLRARGIRTATDFLAACEGRPPDVVVDVARCLECRGTADHIPPEARSAEEHEHEPSDVEEHATHSDTGPVDLDELCASIRRQPVMAQVIGWRSSPLADSHLEPVPLPGIAEVPLPNETYDGPGPVPTRRGTAGSDLRFTPYDGFVLVDIEVSDGSPPEIVEVRFTTHPVSDGNAARILIEEGRPSADVPFDIAVRAEGLRATSGQRSVRIPARGDSDRYVFRLEWAPDAADDTIWVEIEQRGRLMQIAHVDVERSGSVTR